MKKNTVFNFLMAITLSLAVSACSSTRHPHSRGGDQGGAGAYGDADGGAYSEGMGGEGGGFQPSANCHVPSSGGNTESYYFEYDRSDVHPNDLSRLQAIAQQAANQSGKIRVEGNTDRRGSPEYNIGLGWRRANAVASVLEQSGVSRNRINTNSNGAEKPIAFGESDDDFQCNRRVDVTEKE